MSYNQTNEYICFGTNCGFYIYNITPFKQVLSRIIDGGVSMVKMYYNSNILLLVGKSDNGPIANNKLVVWDDSNENVLRNISYDTKIINIDVNVLYITISTEYNIYIYNFNNLSLLKTINTSYNPKGIFAINYDDYNNIIYKGDIIGSICISDINSCKSTILQAHDNTIDYIYLSKNNMYIVTASDRGTIIRIFDMATLSKKNEFRRGTDPSRIIDINMSDDFAILLVTSEKGTIHLFNTDLNLHLGISNNEFRKFGINYIKFALPKYFHSKWSFVQFHLKDIYTKTIFDKNNYRVYSFSNKGQLYVLNFEQLDKPIIEQTINFLSDELDPFANRNTTIK